MNYKILFVSLGLYDQIYVDPIVNEMSLRGFSVRKLSLFKGADNSLIQKIMLHIPVFLNLLLFIKLLVISKRYNIIIFYRPNYASVTLLKLLKLTFSGKDFITYNNDRIVDNRHWLNFRRSLKYFDSHIVYRLLDIDDYYLLGGANFTRMYPFSNEHRFGANNNIAFDDREYDLVFIGHFEEDGRDEVLNKVDKLFNGLIVKGPRWEFSNLKESLKVKACALHIKDYFEHLCNSKICIIFLSTQNADLYTRRCFEIPHCNSVALMPKNSETSKVFSNDECIYYNDLDDLYELISQKGKLLELARKRHEYLHCVDHYKYTEKRAVDTIIKHLRAYH